MIKRILSVLIVLALLAAGTVSFAEGAETAASGDYQYVLQADGTAKITGYTGSAAELVIPDSIDGHAVTALGTDAFYSQTGLTSVVIPDSVTEIGEAAFQYCISLEKVVLPQGLTGLSKALFSNCYRLSELNLPEGLKVVGAYAFAS